MELKFVRENLAVRPFKVCRNRQWRTYSGGLLLEKWEDMERPEDGDRPEEWVASVVEARSEEKTEGLGLSSVEDDDGNQYLLRDIILSDPAGFLGKKHANRYKNNMALLVKVIDSLNRLPMQVHPDKDYSKRVFSSDYGKTEAWYIIGGRQVEGREPYVLLGFKEGVTREKWRGLIDRQEVDGMVQCLHRFPVKPGDVFLVESGVPHAIGSGCFLIEIQEPTDYTMRVEKKLYDGSVLPDFLRHQGVGFEKMLDCFNYDTFSREEILKRWYKQPRTMRQVKGNREIMLLSSKDTPCFSMRRLEAADCLCTPKENVFTIAVVLSGRGKIRWDGGELPVAQSDGIFLPAGIGDLGWVKEGEDVLSAIRCYPPETD